MHPDVIAHTDATNAGNRHNLSEVRVGIISMQQKRQRYLGRFDAMIYFEQNKKLKKLTWSVIYDDDKEREELENLAILCHCEIKK
jgi:hypothetical protein